MKKIQKFVLVLLAASVVMLTSCGSKDPENAAPAPTPQTTSTTTTTTPSYNVPGAYINEFPFATQDDENEDSWEYSACGAFCMAYYLAIKGYFPKDKIKEQAQIFYNKIKFTGEAASYFGEYSDPVKIATEIAPYVEEAEFRMNTSRTSYDESSTEEKAEYILCELKDDLGIQGVVNAPVFADALAENEYVIEIVVPSNDVNTGDPLRYGLHYVLTYKKNNTLYTLDPFIGTEYPREGFKTGTPYSVCFCNGGLFFTPKN